LGRDRSRGRDRGHVRIPLQEYADPARGRAGADAALGAHGRGRRARAWGRARCSCAVGGRDRRPRAMTIYDVRPLDVSGLKTVSIGTRASKITAAQFARPVSAADASLVTSLPATLAGADLRRLAEADAAARRRGRRVLWGVGAHVLKVGLSPILIDLLEKGFV